MAVRDFDIIEDLKPIGGGWRYFQLMRDGSLQRVPLQGAAKSAAHLVELIRQLRMNEGILLGDVERDVAEYIRKVSPINDRFRGKGGALNQPRPEPFIPLIQRIREWLDYIGPKKPRIVDLDEAIARAQICINCPQNVLWKTNCGECNATCDYLGSTIRGKVSFQLDDALHGCRLHNFHLPCAVFIDRDFLPQRNPKTPAPCWIPTNA